MHSLQVLQARREAISEITSRCRVYDICVFGSVLHAQLRKFPGQVG